MQADRETNAATPDSLQLVIKDIMQSRRVDGYTEDQCAFLHALADRLDWIAAGPDPCPAAQTPPSSSPHLNEDSPQSLGREAATAEPRDEDEQYTLDRAADLLEDYAQEIKVAVAEVTLEYSVLQEVEMIAKDLRALAAAPVAGVVPMPQNADEAAGMAMLGEAWLRANAPDRLRAPVGQAEDAARWQPIETAPQDGTAIFAFWEAEGGSVSRHCYGLTLMDSGIWVGADDSEVRYAEPTHWQPLAPPPLAQQAGQAEPGGSNAA